jgi:hypothetical protein
MALKWLFCIFGFANSTNTIEERASTKINAKRQMAKLCNAVL